MLCACVACLLDAIVTTDCCDVLRGVDVVIVVDIDVVVNVVVACLFVIFTL